MSYHYSEFPSEAGPYKGAKAKAEVEVILMGRGHHTLFIKDDESSPPRTIPDHGVKVLKTVDGLTTLRMSESKAIEHGLV